MTADLELRPHALYRFFGPGGTLLYIGITADLPARMKTHRDEKAWWLSIANITIEHFPDRTSVLEAERRAIATEKPLYNDKHNTAAPRTWDLTAPTAGKPASRPSAFRVLCMGCGKPAPAGAAIHCPYDRIHVVEAAYREHRRTVDSKLAEDGVVSLDAWLALPVDAAWMVHCDDCNPHHDRETDTYCDRCYWFAVDRCRTWPALIGWTSHLSQKNWLEYTDWMQFIGHIARTGVMGGATDPADRPMDSTATRDPKFMRIVADQLAG